MSKKKPNLWAWAFALLALCSLGAFVFHQRQRQPEYALNPTFSLVGEWSESDSGNGFDITDRTINLTFREDETVIGIEDLTRLQPNRIMVGDHEQYKEKRRWVGTWKLANGVLSITISHASIDGFGDMDISSLPWGIIQPGAPKIFGFQQFKVMILGQGDQIRIPFLGTCNLLNGGTYTYSRVKQ